MKSNDKRIRSYVPNQREDHVLYKPHDELGHMERDKMIEAIGKTYWFPIVKSKASDHVQNCLNG